MASSSYKWILVKKIEIDVIRISICLVCRINQYPKIPKSVSGWALSLADEGLEKLYRHNIDEDSEFYIFISILRIIQASQILSSTHVGRDLSLYKNGNRRVFSTVIFGASNDKPVIHDYCNESCCHNYGSRLIHHLYPYCIAQRSKNIYENEGGEIWPNYIVQKSLGKLSILLFYYGLLLCTLSRCAISSSMVAIFCAKYSFS